MIVRTLYQHILKEKLLLVLFWYHILFVFLAYKIRVDRGISDAHFYWGKTFDIHQFVWFDFLYFGTDFILFLNYFFIKLELPFIFGFLLYGCVGFLGILQFRKFLYVVVPTPVLLKNIDLRLLLLFLPNLHFWTAGLGKEALCFLSIAVIFLKIAEQQYTSWKLFVALFFLIVIRPHIALMLLFSVYVGFLIWGNWTMKKKLLSLLFATAIFVGLFKMFLILAELDTFRWDKLMLYNSTSLLSFDDTNTYVPIVEYSYPYKVFTFYFRPLFFEIPTFLGAAVGLENALVLVFHAFAFAYGLYRYKTLKFSFMFKVVLLYAFVAGILIVQRYSGLGIFIRTKVMIQPFVLVVLLSLFSQNGGALFKKDT
ncbi:hypothetical protein ABGT15_08410 [Flavobacterium enshiense]|uniref:hypothetical protein n=1 Tax=Flavobacterium enshiense TaxID=1341165 RepID=UPI00345DDE68